MRGFNWTLATGEAVIESDRRLNFSENGSVVVLVEHNYSSPGEYDVTFKVENASYLDLELLRLDLVEVLIRNASVLSTNGTVAVSEFVVENQFTSNTSFNWSYDTNDSTIIESENETTLDEGFWIPLLIEHDYSDTGTYDTALTVNTSSYGYEDSLEVLV